MFLKPPGDILEARSKKIIEERERVGKRERKERKNEDGRVRAPMET